MNYGDLIFHHIGIPVPKSSLGKNAKYSKLFKMYSENCVNDVGIRMEYHAFDDDSSLNELIKTKPHVAFKTKKLGEIEQILAGKEILMPLYEPFKGYKCAMILVNSMPIEIIETNIPEDKLWDDDETIKNGVLYANTDGNVAK